MSQLVVFSGNTHNVRFILGMDWVQFYAEYCAKGEQEIYDHHRDAILAKVWKYRCLGIDDPVGNAVADYWGDDIPWDGSSDPEVDYTVYNGGGYPMPLV